MVHPQLKTWRDWDNIDLPPIVVTGAIGIRRRPPCGLVGCGCERTRQGFGNRAHCAASPRKRTTSSEVIETPALSTRLRCKALVGLGFLRVDPVGEVLAKTGLGEATGCGGENRVGSDKRWRTDERVARHATCP